MPQYILYTYYYLRPASVLCQPFVLVQTYQYVWSFPSVIPNTYPHTLTLQPSLLT